MIIMKNQNLIYYHRTFVCTREETLENVKIKLLAGLSTSIFHDFFSSLFFTKVTMLIMTFILIKLMTSKEC